MPVELNPNIKHRDEIIFGKHDEDACLSDVQRDFDSLSLGDLNQLIKFNFIDPNDKQNNCPAVKEIFEFMKKYPDYAAHGYIVTKNLNEYRIIINGLNKDGQADSWGELEDFEKLFGHADVFSTDMEMYCWFDLEEQNFFGAFQ